MSKGQSESPKCGYCPYCGSGNVNEGRHRIYRCERCRMKWAIDFADQMKALPKRKSGGDTERMSRLVERRL